MGLETHKRYVKGTIKWWRDFGKVHSEKDKISFRADFIVELFPDKQKELDCKYIWGERILSRGGKMSPRKEFWLPRMLSYDWLIVKIGKPWWKAGWDCIRPDTYPKDKEPPEEKYKEGIYDLLQCLKYPHFFKKELHIKHES